MRRPALVLLALLVTGCSPSDEEAGRAVLLSSPVWLAAGLGLLWLLARLWRRLDECV